MKLTPFAKLFVTLVVLGVVGFVVFNKFGDQVKVWATGHTADQPSPNAPQEVGKTDTYSWVYNPTLRISNDPFKDNKDVLKKRQANKWDFGGEKEEVMKYTRSRGVIMLTVNTEYFKNNYKDFSLAGAATAGGDE